MLRDCPTIHVGGAHELFWRVIQQIRLGGLSNKFYRNLVASFREQKSFVLKTVILLAFGLGTDMAKVRRFENGLKLSIRGRILGLRLQDMDYMVGTALTIEREIEDARSTRDAGVSNKMKESQSSSSSRKK